jgi:hypothetical protein
MEIEGLVSIEVFLLEIIKDQLLCYLLQCSIPTVMLDFSVPLLTFDLPTGVSAIIAKIRMILWYDRVTVVKEICWCSSRLHPLSVLHTHFGTNKNWR